MDKKSEKFRKLCTEALSTPEGREIFKKLYCKYFPKETHAIVIEMIDNGMPAEQFLSEINDSALDSYNLNKDKDVFKTIEASEETRKEFKIE